MSIPKEKFMLEMWSRNLLYEDVITYSYQLNVSTPTLKEYTTFCESMNLRIEQDNETLRRLNENQ